MRNSIYRVRCRLKDQHLYWISSISAENHVKYRLGDAFGIASVIVDFLCN